MLRFWWAHTRAADCGGRIFPCVAFGSCQLRVPGLSSVFIRSANLDAIEPVSPAGFSQISPETAVETLAHRSEPSSLAHRAVPIHCTSLSHRGRFGGFPMTPKETRPVLNAAVRAPSALRKTSLFAPPRDRKARRPFCFPVRRRVRLLQGSTFH